ncbi:MAG: winged helix-turn-helix domain-containing protein [Phycisphaeraceae bacterium]
MAPGSTPTPRSKATTTSKATVAETDKPRRARKRVKAGQGVKAEQASTTTKPAKKATTKKKATPVKKKATPVKKKVAVKKKPTTQSSKSEKKSPKGCLEAAITVLGKSKKPMGCKTLMDAILEQKLWSTQGATPHQTLSSAIQREITKKGKASRFVKVERGLFTINKAAATPGKAS